MMSHRVEFTTDEFLFIRTLIRTQRFNPDPILEGLRKKFSVEEQDEKEKASAFPFRVIKGEEG